MHKESLNMLLSCLTAVRLLVSYCVLVGLSIPRLIHYKFYEDLHESSIVIAVAGRCQIGMSLAEQKQNVM